jgi:YVTN family beta-propeller protein
MLKPLLAVTLLVVPMRTLSHPPARRALAPTPSPALLVLEKEQNTLVIVDPATLTIVARIPAGDDPHEVAVSDDGRTAWVTNYRGRNGGPGGSTITPIDLVAQKALAPIQLGALRAPHGVATAGGKLYFTAEQSKVVARFDPATNAIDWVMGTGEDRTHMVTASHDGSVILTTNVNSPSVSIIAERALPLPTAGPGAPPAGAPPGGPPRNGAAPKDWHVTNIKVGRGAEGMDLSPDGRELWVANAGDATISIIDVATLAVVATIPSTHAANRLKLTLDGRFAFVSDLAGNDMLVIETKSRKPHVRIALGGNSEGIVMSADGTRAYTTLNSKDAVAVIDLRTMKVTGEVKTGRGPDGLAWAVRH